MTGPVFKRIAAAVRDRIETGVYGPDEPLPTNVAVAEEFSVHRHTADKAFEELINEGLVESRGSRGRFVRIRERHIYRPQEEFGRPTSDVMDRFMARVTAEGRTPTQRIAVELVQPPARVARAFGTGDDVVVLRRRDRAIDGELVYINDSYYPRALVEGTEIMLPVDIARGAIVVLDEIDARQVRAIDQHLIRMPTAEEVTRLELLPATPVDEVLTVGLTADDRAVRCMVTVLPGDRVEIWYERERPVDQETAPE